VRFTPTAARDDVPRFRIHNLKRRPDSAILDSEFMNGTAGTPLVAPWHSVPSLGWDKVTRAARRRMAGATRKLGEIELDVLLELVAEARAPRLTLDLRTLEDPDDLKTSEMHAVGPALQRALQDIGAASAVAYLLANADIARALSDQFTLHSVPARNGAPAQPLLGLGLLEDRAIVLGPLPRYLEEVFALVAAVGEATAVDLHESRDLPLATASDYLGELYRLRVVLRERETLRVAAAVSSTRSGSRTEKGSRDKRPSVQNRTAE
jgi:hypothetical protein